MREITSIAILTHSTMVVQFAVNEKVIGSSPIESAIILIKNRLKQLKNRLFFIVLTKTLFIWVYSVV